MARKENLAFLDSVCPPTVKDRSYDALLTWLFGTEERTIAVCVKPAYQSMKRKSRELMKTPKEDIQAHYKDIVDLILQRMDYLFRHELSQQETFDAWHKSTCEQIIEISDKHNLLLQDGFTFGRAQYLLNLTIKNMLLMEQWGGNLEPIRKHLHIPAQYHILEAASEKLGIKVMDNLGQFNQYSFLDSKPYKKWNYFEYIKFQEDVRNAADCPIDWEFSAWNKTKEKRASE